VNDTDLLSGASATILADAAALVAHAPAPSLPPLRDAMLSGSFVGKRDTTLEDTLSDFLLSDGGDAVDRWFGTDAGRRLRIDPDALRGALDRDIAAIDALLSEQVDAILHEARLRRLEGTWRGIAWLVDGTDQSTRLKIKLLNAGWHEICRDLERAIEFDQSQMFRKIYEDEFGTPGGEPYGLMVVDYEVRHRPTAAARTDDVSALAALSGVAAASFCPMILGASPTLLEVDGFADLASVVDITAPLRNTDHARWRSLSTRPDMRFIGVALPHLLARPPWEDDGTRADGFRYAEYAPTSEERVWMGAGYAFATVVARAFANYAWPADVRGVETDRIGGGLVEGVPLEPFRTDPDFVWCRPSLEIVWNDHQERALLDAGLMPLSAIPFSDELVFGAVRSLLVPQRYTGATAMAADANARLSSQINSILCASRFAHHLKMKGRQMVGSFKTADEIERLLQEWLTQYVNANLGATGDSRARFPLVGGRVRVQELTGKPGHFGCVVQLQPHYQLDDVSATFQLVTDLGSR
jgi:type VI secretion system ImpC/EvpB family protein